MNIDGRNLLKIDADRLESIETTRWQVTVKSSTSKETTDSEDLSSYSKVDQSSVRVFRATDTLGLTSCVYGEAAVLAQDSINRSRNFRRSRNKPQTADKIFTRVLAGKIDLIKQPEWHSLAHIPSYKGSDIIFQNIDLSLLPIARDQDTESLPHTIIFEDQKSGFVLNYKSGFYTLQSNNQRVLEAFSHQLDNLKPSQVEAQLKILSSKGFSIQSIVHDTSSLRREFLIETFTKLPDGKWFVKDVDGSLGNHVASFEIKVGKIIEIDIPTSQKDRYYEHTDKSYAESSLEEQLDFVFTGKDQTFPMIDSAILEKAIPTEKIKGIIAEPRVCMFYENARPKYLCSYSKCSIQDQTEVNKAQGGESESVENSFKRILRKRNVSEDRLATLVEQSINKMKEQATEFALEFNSLIKERNFHYGPLFAIDLCPVWNAKAQEIDFVLLEVQPEPGTVGVKGNIPPDEVKAVHAYDESISNLYDFEM